MHVHFLLAKEDVSLKMVLSCTEEIRASVQQQAARVISIVMFNVSPLMETSQPGKSSQN